MLSSKPGKELAQAHANVKLLMKLPPAKPATAILGSKNIITSEQSTVQILSSKTE